MLGYFRSQHDNQSWVAALTVILDARGGGRGGGTAGHPGPTTFAMARHAAVDLASTLGTPPEAPQPDRLEGESLRAMRLQLAERGVVLASGEEADRALAGLRSSYEPYVSGLSRRLRMPLPPWFPAEGATDNWEVTRWEDSSGRRARREFGSWRSRREAASGLDEVSQ